MNNIIGAFMIGLIIGLIIKPIIDFISEANKKKAKAKKVLPSDKMIVPDDLDEVKYTNSWLKKLEHSLMTNGIDWSCEISSHNIIFKKKEDKKSIEIRIDYNVREKKFIVSDLRVYASSGWSSDLIMTGDASDEITTFVYNKYIDFKKKENAYRIMEIDKKMQIIDDVLGKSVDRDMKLDKLIS